MTRTASALRTLHRHAGRLVLTLLLAGTFATDALATEANPRMPREQTLDGDWQFRLPPDNAQADEHADATEWRTASVPGTVHTDLFAHELIPDPYVGAPEAQLQWIGLADWEYRRSFDVDAATLRAARSELVFEGLDTFADVYLNGHRLLQADNSHRTWRVPVREHLHARGNELRVVFHSPIRRMLPQVQAMPHRIAGNYPSPYGDEPKDAMTANFVRKPGYHYGWDWGPRFVTAGIWQSVTLQSWDTLRIADLHIEQKKVDADEAVLEAQVELDAVGAGEATLDLSWRAPDGREVEVVSKEVQLKPGLNEFALPLRIAQPQRWFPVGYGKQSMYGFQLRVRDASGLLAQASRRTGLRSVELRRDRDATGQGMAFVINGIPIFAKGANAIPFDMFPPRVTRAQIRRVLESARDANMNMIRSWGGGYYYGDVFYEIADELGIMIWQDFMFGGGMQPGYDPAFRASVVAEARDQVRRLRDHPGIVLWCGNNEEEIAWKNWGQGKTLKEAAPEFAEKVWNGYVQLFGKDLRQVVAEEAGGIPYWSSSPSNDLDDIANQPHSGDMHYWSVWIENKPVEEYLNVTPRFMSEFGLQGWPVMRTIRAFAGSGALSIDDPVIVAHQKFLAGKGNARILDYIRMQYREPRDFAGFVYLSQVMQAEGMELASLHHRASRPTTMGSLYWQLNDVWPGASWSGIDYFGRWKPLQFHARRFFAPLAVAALRKDGQTRVTLVSDRTEPVSGELRTRVMDFDGKLHRDERRSLTLAPLAATEVASHADAELLRGADPRRTVAVFELLVDGQPVSRRLVYFDAAKALDFADPQLDAQLHPDAGGYRLDLQARRLTRALWIDFGDLDAELSDNALSLLPGERVSLRITSPASLDALRDALSLRSLAGIHTAVAQP